MFTFEKKWVLGNDYDKIAHTFLYLDDERYCHNRFDESVCAFGATLKKPEVLLLGDSHAGHYQPFLNEVGYKQNFSFLARTYDACIPVITEDMIRIEKVSSDQKCIDQIIWSAKNFIRFNTIILAASWDGYVGESSPNPFFEREITNTIDMLVKNKKQVVILELVPDCPDLMGYYRTQFTVRRFFTDEKLQRQAVLTNCNRRANKTNPYLKNLAEKHGAIFIPALEEFQKQVGKMPFVGDEFFYKDGVHCCF